MKRALLVGINDFADPSASLKGCVNDVNDMKDMLTCLFKWDTSSIKLLLNSRATKDGIVNGLKELVSLTKPGDIALFHVSCHGSQVPAAAWDKTEEDHLVEVLCSYDFPSQWDTPLTDDIIADIIKDIPVGARFYMIGDLCHSGTLTRGIFQRYRKSRMVTPPADLMSQVENRELPVKGFFSSLKPNKLQDVRLDPTNKSKYVYISGCRDNQTSADAYISGRYNGALTATLIDEASKNLSQSWLNLYHNTAKALKTSNFEQVPQITGDAKLVELPIFV